MHSNRSILSAGIRAFAYTVVLALITTGITSLPKFTSATQAYAEHELGEWFQLGLIIAALIAMIVAARRPTRRRV